MSKAEVDFKLIPARRRVGTVQATRNMLCSIIDINLGVYAYQVSYLQRHRSMCECHHCSLGWFRAMQSNRTLNRIPVAEIFTIWIHKNKRSTVLFAKVSNKVDLSRVTQLVFMNLWVTSFEFMSWSFFDHGYGSTQTQCFQGAECAQDIEL